MNLYTDGCGLPHVNCGGWAYILDGKEGNGHRWGQGNNQMELLAVINGLKSVTEPSDFTVYTDSDYVIISACRQRKNPGLLILEIKRLLEFHQVIFIKVKSGSHPIQNRAHDLAREAMFEAIKSRSEDRMASSSPVHGVHA